MELSFFRLIEKESKQNINLCYQCNKCTAGCPVVYEMDYTPAQIVHLIRLGMEDLVLTSKTIWLCASCQTCNTRCPQEVDIAKVMDALRIIARRQKIKPKVKEIAAFYNLVLLVLRSVGCIYELAVAGIMRMITKTLIKDMPLAIEFIKKGRLSLFPNFRNIFKINKIFRKVKKYEEI